MKDLSVSSEQVIETQRELSELVGCPGHEEAVAGYLLAKVEPLVDRAWLDPLGNVLAIRKGSDPQGQSILLDGHMDEVGFMVSHIEEKGFLRVETLGGIDRRILPGLLLQFPSGSGPALLGVIGSEPPHVTTPEQREKVPEIKDLFVDVGADSPGEVRARGLDVGSVGSFYTPFQVLGEKRLLGKAFDDRTACNVILQVLTALGREKAAHTVLVSLSVQEEYKGAGAWVGARSLNPSMALVLENTTATDMPDVPARKVVTRLGGGPALTAADRSVVVPKRILARLKKAAELEQVPWQYKKPIYGGTNSGHILRSGSGVPTGVVSVPCRYIHGPAAICEVEDILNTIRLVRGFCLLP